MEVDDPIARRHRDLYSSTNVNLFPQNTGVEAAQAAKDFQVVAAAPSQHLYAESLSKLYIFVRWDWPTCAPLVTRFETLSGGSDFTGEYAGK